MKYICGRSNLAATIFVPYDCNNNCPFCTSKALYRDNTENMKLLKDNIRLINKTSKIKDVVITGGEPFADLEKLGEILSLISINKRVFINTSMPIKDEESRTKVKEFLKKYKRQISALNISRHLSVSMENDTNDKFINSLRKIVNLKINCVLYNIELNEESATKFKEFIKRFPNANICFRADYRGMTFEKLKTLNDPFIAFVVNHLGAKYIQGGGCQVCNDDSFKVEIVGIEHIIHYHRGMEHSSIQIGDSVIINDIIIMPDSHMCYDWDNKRPESPYRMLDVLKDLGYCFKNFEDTFAELQTELERTRRKNGRRIVDYSCGSGYIYDDGTSDRYNRYLSDKNEDNFISCGISHSYYRCGRSSGC